jgi:hypothetical protein
MNLAWLGRCTSPGSTTTASLRFVVLFLGSHREQDAVEPLGAIWTPRRAVLLFNRLLAAASRRRGPSKARSRLALAVAGLCVVPNIRSRCTPRMRAALAGVVHRRQGAASAKHDHRENNQQGGIHRNLAAAETRHSYPSSFSLDLHEPAVNVGLLAGSRQINVPVSPMRFPCPDGPR